MKWLTLPNKVLKKQKKHMGTKNLHLFSSLVFDKILVIYLVLLRILLNCWLLCFFCWPRVLFHFVCCYVCYLFVLNFYLLNYRKMCRCHHQRAVRGKNRESPVNHLLLLMLKSSSSITEKMLCEFLHVVYNFSFIIFSNTSRPLLTCKTAQLEITAL